jgi:formiminoglutamase
LNILSLFDQQDVSALKSRVWIPGSIGSLIDQYSTDQLLKGRTPTVVLLSVGEPDILIQRVREQLYELYLPNERFSMADLGHLNSTLEDLPEVLARLISYGSFPLIISPEQSITYYQYLAYCRLERTVNLISVDDRPDLDEAGALLGETNWLSHILSHAPNFLFNYSLIGHQIYLSNPDIIRSLELLHFDLHRLGQVRQSGESTEPFFRNADFLSFDVSSIRAADSPQNLRSGPNGLYAEEACRLIRYAGMSNKLSSAGIYGWLSTSSDYNPLTATLVSQQIWHLLDGLFNRIEEGAPGNAEDFTIYKVSSGAADTDLQFYKSNRSGRWWMYVPMNNSNKNRFKKHQIVPCSYEDYQQAMKGEIPETWWQTFQKMT